MIKATKQAIDILINWFLIFNLFKKYKGTQITGKDITKPNVGDIPALNPAYIGKNKPSKRYKPMTITESINDDAVRPIIKTINNCSETLMLSPNGKENIPMTHIKANKIAFFVNLWTVDILSISPYVFYSQYLKMLPIILMFWYTKL